MTGLLTRGLGLGQPAARLLTRGLGSATAVVVLPPDLLAAVEARFHAVLGADFGEDDPVWRPKIWIGLAADGAALPYLVVDAVEGVATYDSSQAPVSPAELLLRVYAPTRAQAGSLARLTARSFQDAPLRWQGAGAALCRSSNPLAQAVQDPERWKDGSQAWGIVLRFELVAGGKL